MGNQSGKVSVKNSKFIDDVDPKNSRTNWIAGVASSPGRPVIELSTRMTAPEEDSVTDEINLSWATPLDDGGYPITGYRVEMLDIQSGKWIEVTFIEGYEPKCTLSNILYGIMYRFRVVALNDAGSSEPGEPSEPIVIDVPGVQIAPYFVQMLNDTIALEHEKVAFQVRVLGTPKPSIQWYKDDVEIFACDRIEMREEDEGGAVVLKEARLSDSGTIKCVASNILGRCTSTALFSIEAAPRFELPENYSDGLIFRQDEVIHLRVPMIAKPAPKVVWFFEDEPISAGTDLAIETTDSFTKLRIQGAKRWHCGEFRVYAENEYGEDACSILVTVTSPPSPPGRPVVIDISETKCTLRWEPSEDDGGADVKHYIVEYFRDVWEVWLKAKTTKETQVTIDDLIPGSRYKFRIKSENSYGISEPGEESDPFDVGGASSDSRRQKSLESLESEAEIIIPSAPRPKRWSDVMAEDSASWVSSPTPEVNIEVTPETPVAPKRKANNMAKAKELWGSDEQDDDILDRFLKAKRFQQQNPMPSIDSDGIPSMVGISEDYPTDSEAEHGGPTHRSTHNVRRLYAELQQFSSDHPDLESVSEDEIFDFTKKSSLSNKQDNLMRAKELYEELTQMSVDGDQSIEDLVQGISTSNESVASIIPLEKRQELSKFELTLKEMIQEAKQMAKTPSGSQENLSYRDYQRSPSMHSIAESVVSVIEKPLPPQQSPNISREIDFAKKSPIHLQQQQQHHHLKPSMISVTPEILVTPEPTPPRSTPPVRPPRTPSPRRNSTFNDLSIQQQQQQYATPSPKVTEKGFQWPTTSGATPQMQADNRNQVVGPPAASPTTSGGGRSPGGRLSRADLNSMAPAVSPGAGPSASTPMARRDSNVPATTKPTAPLVGADRYEEIIKARDRSSSRGPGSIQGSMTNLFQPGITMAMREETKQMSLSKSSLTMSRSSLISSSMMVDNLDSMHGGNNNNLNSMAKLNQSLSNIERPSSSMANLQSSSSSLSQTNLNNNNHFNAGSQPTLNESQQSLNMNNGTTSQTVGNNKVLSATVPSPSQSFVPKRPLTSQQPQKQPQPQRAPQSTAHGPAHAPAQNVTIVQQQPQKPAFQPKIIEPSIDPLRPENRPNYYNVRSSYPDWLMITCAYSMVFVTIILLSNITPNGKLFIHFTAFWSMVLYFSIDKTDEETTDVIDTVMENFVKTKSSTLENNQSLAKQQPNSAAKNTAAASTITQQSKQRGMAVTKK